MTRDKHFIEKTEAYEKGYNTAVEHCAKSVAEARKQERERIADWLTRKVYSEGLLIPHWIVDALKEGGKEAE